MWFGAVWVELWQAEVGPKLQNQPDFEWAKLSLKAAHEDVGGGYGFVERQRTPT